MLKYFFSVPIYMDSSIYKPCKTLGTLRGFYIGVTLNYSPSFIFKVGKSSIAWGRLTPDQQKEIFQKHIQDVYKHHFKYIEYAFELTKTLMLHCHAIGYLDEPEEHKDYHLQTIRQLVGQHPDVVRYAKGKRHQIITANYIHHVEKDKWETYIRKDLGKVPYKLQTVTNYK